MGEMYIKFDFLFVTFILFVLISLTCVSAADNQTDDIVALDTNTLTEEILTDENNSNFTELSKILLVKRHMY